MLDSDARESALKDYAVLNKGALFNRIRIIDCPDGYDPSDMYRDFGKGAILKLLASAKKVDDYDLMGLAYKKQVKCGRK
jgi:hypothetical protein